MKNVKKIEIPQLYKLKSTDKEKLILTYMNAFEEYPKLLNAFPDEKTRLIALEATLRFYTAYDLKYGCGFSLDENIHEAVLVVHSEAMNYSLLKHIRAGSYSRQYRNAMKKLTSDERKMRLRLFEELDRLEKDIKVPSPHIYADFLGVAKKHQHQGRGKRLMSYICSYADQVGLPLMLFTNTDDDVKFYQSLGFKIIGETSSKEFGFTNTYLLYQ